MYRAIYWLVALMLIRAQSGLWSESRMVLATPASSMVRPRTYISSKCKGMGPARNEWPRFCGVAVKPSSSIKNLKPFCWLRTSTGTARLYQSMGVVLKSPAIIIRSVWYWLSCSSTGFSCVMRSIKFTRTSKWTLHISTGVPPTSSSASWAILSRVRYEV